MLYGAETWGAKEKRRRMLYVFEMQCLRGMVGGTLRDRIKNDCVRIRRRMVNKLRRQSRFTCFEMGQAYGEDG